jgi:hypothetical protein
MPNNFVSNEIEQQFDRDHRSHPTIIIPKNELPNGYSLFKAD